MGEKRSYGQHCTVARALDAVGERWTLLLVRELSTGPKRFKDLLGGLPGIGTNLLAGRLKALEGEGIVRRATLPPPAGSNVYELTELGRGLEPVVVALSRWGARLLDAPREDDELTCPYAPARRVRPGEEGHDRPWTTPAVAVVEVIGLGIVEVDGLLDQPEPENARVEVHVALRLAGDGGYVVDSCCLRHGAPLYDPGSS